MPTVPERHRKTGTENPRKINLIGDESLCVKGEDACKDKGEKRTGDDVFAHRFLYRFEVSSAPSVFLLSSPVLGSWVNQERVVMRKTDRIVSLKGGFLGMWKVMVGRKAGYAIFGCRACGGCSYCA